LPYNLTSGGTNYFTIEHEQVLRMDLNNSEIRYIFVYFPDTGCVRTLRTLYVYATARSPWLVVVIDTIII